VVAPFVRWSASPWLAFCRDAAAGRFGQDPGWAVNAGARPALPVSERRSLARAAPVLPVVLLLGAAAISGFTLLRELYPYDEGHILLAARRVAAGDLPYADFVFPYGPGHPLLLGSLEELLGPSLLWWRIVRVCADAAVALIVFVLVRREAPLLVALVAWLIAAAAMAQPGGSNPFAVAIALGLCAFAVATATPPRAGRGAWRRPAIAGVLVALAAFWRLDFGLFAGLAILVALALAPGAQAVRVRAAGTFALAALGLGVVLYAPFAIAAGPGSLYEQMVADALRYSSYWTLPFPLAFDEAFRLWPPASLAEDVKDLVGFYVPLALVAGLVVGAAACLLRWLGEGRPWRWLGLLVFALGAAAYMRSRADEFHTQPLLVVLTVLLACAATWLVGERRRHAGAVLLAGSVALLVLLGVYGTANRVSALLLPPELEPVGLPGTGGVKAPPGEAEVLRRVVPYVQARVPPGAPIFVAPRRSDLVRFDNLLFYILADRDTVLDAGATLQALPAEQRLTIAALERQRPRVVVRWTDPLSSQREPNRRGRPSGSRALDAYLARVYGRVAVFGDYQVLRRRGDDPMP
jgi:hypothetical protein